MLRSTTFKIILIFLFAIFLTYYDLPGRHQTLPGTPKFLRDAGITLGLDLQGGSQLDYKIDLRKVPEKDRKSIVEGVKNVINKRVNSLGVSEPNIYTSAIADEQHLIVELAGVKDLNKAKKVVGKTIQLEFKEQRDKEDPEHTAKVKKNAQSVLAKIRLKPKDFELLAQEEVQAAPGKVEYKSEWKMISELEDPNMKVDIFKVQPGTLIPKLIESSSGFEYQADKVVPRKGFFIVQVESERETSSLKIEEKAISVSHILISYKGAERAAETITRSKEEAKKLVEEIMRKLAEGARFEDSAKEFSDEPGAKESLGKLPSPVRKGGSYVESFTNATLALSKDGELSPIIETPFGLHIIRADDFTQRKINQLFFSSMPDQWQETSLTGEHFVRADVSFDNLSPIVQIKFNEAGAKLFEKITERNVGKPVAIFVGGQLISSPTVQQKIIGDSAVITGRFTVEEAQGLARDLNTGAIPAPVVLSGQYTIGATLGQEALSTSLRAGIIGVVILTLFMILYYRLPGLVAIFALSLYTAILLFLIKAQLPLIVSLAVSLFIFSVIIYTILKSREGGLEKLLTFVLAVGVLFFVTFLLSKSITLTLAGIAGVILSIGMAVDANILIFERTKEELRTGKALSAAIEAGFDRAWSPIRDSNFSSLITCAILFYFGTSIIQGFAFNLAAGILVSMFTAIAITRTLLMALMHTKLGQNLWLWGLSTRNESPRMLRIVENMKLWFGFSGSVIAVALIALFAFGLKLGIDFKGGTLLDISFETPVTAEAIKQELSEIHKELEAAPKASASSATVSDQKLQSITPIDLGASRVVSVPNGRNQFLINLFHIDNDTHDKLLKKFEEKFGKLTENRFTTIGPVVGETLKKRAVTAVVIAMVAIVLYISFAFRKVPKRVSPWKFGVCAIVALIHDVLIPIGVFAVLQLEVDALFITALLTVLGFSVHDTIVVFDRIRENLKFQGRDESFTEVANKSMTQTMARSINTSVTTLITLTALLLLGSPSIFNFILVLVIGIVIGTYSSIFIASPLLVLWQKKLIVNK